MMSCGTSSRYGSSLLLKKADFSIQGVVVRAMRNFLSRAGEEVFMTALLCGLFKGPQHDVATCHSRVQRLLGGFLSCQRGLHFLGPDIAHLHHVSEPQAARILGRLLVGELLERRLQDRVLLIEAVPLGLFIRRLCDWAV